MSSSYKSGFTLIETMLFLAITGALVVGVLVGTGASINIQRYHDSVTSLKSLLQKQYSDTMNVQNELRTTNISCNPGAYVDTSGATKPRGQSDCVVMGKYITIDSKDITTSTIIGHSGSEPSSPSDIGLIQSYNLSTLSSSSEASQLAWGTKIAWPVSGGPQAKPVGTARQIAILIIRSPQSGQTYTFTSDSITGSMKSIIIAGNNIPGQSQRRICINSDGLSPGGNDQAILINAYATSAGDIETRPNSMDTGGYQC